ncbi:hypothetical protein E8E15_010214 [Penicillium rubens]|uniref:Pc12g08120 protein n=2 Tax=Penicillium chrysogenum species complex TaxID=254878 RepID=B6GXY2_PENRW|nr:uncharacterized protein N7525_001746 [Penicillium rubens]KZN85035.1 hypothetical protein EN45_092040 [Penicillium chrysogenum]CAP80439.1 Pc12g08120 [Penicillium rubens Wisconsin 54-1255]KAF3029003.1 hypothetical protein E8E15_010214 [Penicillium rubens]KAJ5034295.1 hypothetical protein NUH16_005729 [Penicillium rubens]KAJ5844005.1 hypothetical protein N7525_001746 [Penicillium rubens]
MFDLPNAKRVRRDEMRSPASSRSPSPAPDDDAANDAYARLGKLLNLDQLDTAQDTISQDNGPSQPADDEDEEQEFEFRLFSAPAKSTEDATKQPGKDTDEKSTEAPSTQKLRIRLHSPTPGSGAGGEGRFVKASRGWDYYFSTPSLQGTKDGEPTAEDESRIAEKKKQFEDMAVSGQHMLTWAKSLVWPGCHLPWRVIHLKRHQTKMPRLANSLPVYVVEGAPVSKSPLTRKKPGKKRRVQLRKRSAAAQAAKENEAEKRTRKNRERKIKRRQKAREQKAAAAGVSVEDVVMADGDDHSSGGEE